MCLAIPYQVVSVAASKVTLEDGRMITVGRDLKPKKGDYIRLAGDVAVDVLSRIDGMRIRQMIARLNN